MNDQIPVVSQDANAIAGKARILNGAVEVGTDRVGFEEVGQGVQHLANAAAGYASGIVVDVLILHPAGQVHAGGVGVDLVSAGAGEIAQTA